MHSVSKEDSVVSEAQKAGDRASGDQGGALPLHADLLDLISI